jgi:hypothetical protein
MARLLKPNRVQETRAVGRGKFVDGAKYREI